MNIKTTARHCLGAGRSLSPAAIIAVTLSLVVGGAGFADAATGGTFILGNANTETSVASLSNSKGIPLSLSAPPNMAPLKVNGKTLVPKLNANYLGGLSASDLQSTGSEGFTAPGTDTPLPFGSSTVVASTGALLAGTYYVTATALIDLPGGGEGTCWITTGSNPAQAVATGGGSGSQEQAAETLAVSVAAGDTLQEWCTVDTGNEGSGDASDAGITAIRILSSSGTTPATTRARAPHHKPMRHAE
jgi:hypothetical protein